MIKISVLKSENGQFGTKLDGVSMWYDLERSQTMLVRSGTMLVHGGTMLVQGGTTVLRSLIRFERV